MTAINRRNALALAGAGVAATLSSIAASAASDNLPGASFAAAPRSLQTEIERMFKAWLAVARGPQDPAEDDDWGSSRYVRLQARIVNAEPTNPRDMAIQFYVDCDEFGSDTSHHFENLVRRLVGKELPMATAPWSAEERLAYHAQEYQRAAQEIDPTATEWWRSGWSDNDERTRFFISGSRKAGKTREA